MGIRSKPMGVRLGVEKRFLMSPVTSYTGKIIYLLNFLVSGVTAFQILLFKLFELFFLRPKTKRFLTNTLIYRVIHALARLTSISLFSWYTMLSFLMHHAAFCPLGLCTACSLYLEDPLLSCSSSSSSKLIYSPFKISLEKDVYQKTSLEPQCDRVSPSCVCFLRSLTTPQCNH